MPRACAALTPETVSSVLAFRPQWHCATYEKPARRGQEEPPVPEPKQAWSLEDDRHWRCALAWMEFLPVLGVREAERAAGARHRCLEGAMRARPCLRAKVHELQAWRRRWWQDFRGRT